MPVGVVIGGQYGSEGKGKVSLWLTQQKKAKMCIRVGGPNSGHTVYDSNSVIHTLRQLPTGIYGGARAVIPSGAYIDVEVLLEEIRANKELIDKVGLSIDPNAWVIEETDKHNETGLTASISSTGSGTGASLIRRIQRSNASTLAKYVLELQPYIEDTKPLMRKALNGGDYLVIEGTQGYGLSLLHSQEYPYVTARDTTASAVVSEAGLSPFDVEDICMCIRTYPIRVAGTSGPLKNEITWKELSNRLGRQVTELTSVTKHVRRVAEFDARLVNKAIEVNTPNMLVLNFCDYLYSFTDTMTVQSVNISNWISHTNECLAAPITHWSNNTVHVSEV